MAAVDSTRYTVVFATVVCVVCAALVSVAAVTLRPAQQANARLYMEKNVLLATGLVAPGERVDADAVEAHFGRDVQARLVDLQTGRLADAKDIDARRYDQRAARNDPSASRVAPENDAGIRRLPRLGVVYFVMKDGRIDQVVIPVEGLGMWGTIYGFLSLAPDATTVRGITYYEHRETPGLGGEIANPAWQAQWRGRHAYDARGEPVIAVIKGAAGPASADPLHVDGLSGATVTSNAVTRLVRFWLGRSGYGSFLDRVRAGELA